MKPHPFLESNGASGAASATDASAQTAGSWAPYRTAHAIDGAGGIDLFYLKPDDPNYGDELKAARECALTGVIMTIMRNGRFRYSDAAKDGMKQQLADYAATIDRYKDFLLLVRTRADLEIARRERRVGVIFTFQGSEPIGEDLDRVTLFREAGLRVLQLTHNLRNIVGDGSLEPGNAGLSRFGHELVGRLNAEHIAVDLAHGAQRTTREAILASKQPVLISHSGCRGLVDSPRLTADAELKLLANRGGMVGIIFWPYLRAQGQQMASDVIRHIEYAIDVCGEDHVGIGTDLGVMPNAITPQFIESNAQIIRDAIEMGVFGADRNPDLFLFPPDLNVANRVERLAGLLSARGHSDARVEKIIGGNFARTLGDIWG